MPIKYLSCNQNEKSKSVGHARGIGKAKMVKEKMVQQFNFSLRHFQI